MIDPNWLMPSFYIGGLVFLAGGQFALHRSNTGKFDSLASEVSKLTNAVTTMTAKDPALQQKVDGLDHEIERLRDHYHDLATATSALVAKSETRYLMLERDLSEIRKKGDEP